MARVTFRAPDIVWDYFVVHAISKGIPYSALIRFYLREVEHYAPIPEEVEYTLTYPRSVHVHFWLLDEIDAVAKELDVSRSEVIRRVMWAVYGRKLQ
jgi:hypothetical protein